jgi:hypothetical protein
MHVNWQMSFRNNNLTSRSRLENFSVIKFAHWRNCYAEEFGSGRPALEVEFSVKVQDLWGGLKVD